MNEQLANTHAFIALLFFFRPSRFAILSDAGPNAVLGQQAHDIWSREFGDARFAALGSCSCRCTGSVSICYFFFNFIFWGFHRVVVVS